MRTRIIFYLRYAAYLRLLPRTRPQPNTAVDSNTLTEAGYARSDYENNPTVLHPVISLQFQFTLQKNSTFILIQSGAAVTENCPCLHWTFCFSLLFTSLHNQNIKICFSPSQDFSKYNLWTRADVPPDRHRF